MNFTQQYFITESKIQGLEPTGLWIAKLLNFNLFSFRIQSVSSNKLKKRALSNWHKTYIHTQNTHMDKWPANLLAAEPFNGTLRGDIELSRGTISAKGLTSTPCEPVL